jgi:hypothetical protein
MRKVASSPTRSVSRPTRVLVAVSVGVSTFVAAVATGAIAPSRTLTTPLTTLPASASAASVSAAPFRRSEPGTYARPAGSVSASVAAAEATRPRLEKASV